MQYKKLETKGRITMQHTDNSEKGFQHLIVKELVEKNSYIETYSNDFDKEFCINKVQLFDFIKATQPVKFQFIQEKGERRFLLLLDKKIQEKGIIETLRKGIKHLDKTIDLFYPEPVSNFNVKAVENYRANIFSVTQELVYSDNRNRIDLVIFLNGLPVVTMELKNAYTHQAVANAIIQYKKTRSPKDKIFNFARCMVHFAADTDEVYMTTELKNGNTYFLPFNKGLNEGKPEEPFGKGNPLNSNGLKTAYLWEEILTRRSLANIIENFAQILSDEDDPCAKKLGLKQKASKKLIFPRYHQLMVVRQLLNDTKQKGVGNRYLVQHSAGSGKSNSIAWLAHQLSVLYDRSNSNHLFDSVLVVTDRRILDKQIGETIKSFAQEKRYVEKISGIGGSKTSQLKAAIINKKKIIITTVQTFPFLLGEMQELQDNRFAIIIDEAHSSQSGDSAAKMNAALASKNFNDLPKDEEGNISTEDLINLIVEGRKMLKNASYFAFTATPKNKTLETFGTPGIKYIDKETGEEKQRFYPFHTYSMKQAIEEGFILDVLQNYTTYKSYYKIRKEVEDNTEYEVKEANKKLRSYVELHEFAIGQKARYMIDHFHNDVHHLIKNKAKAMIVTKSIEAAMKYKDAFDEYLKEINSPYKAIVAYSGKKKHYKTGEELDENGMNNFPNGETDIPCQFRRNEYRFLIVAEKYQTGFDQPLLHTMYVDKQLSSIAAVQTLSRLNRSHPDKTDTFVLDFYNEIKKETDKDGNEIIKGDVPEAFQDFYTTTILSEATDANKLNYIEEKLAEAQVYDNEEVEEHFKLYYAGDNRSACEALINKSVAWFDNELSKDNKIKFKSNAKIFVRTYSYLSKILDFNYVYWEMLWLYLKYLIPKLHIAEDEDEENILEAVNMDSYRVSKIQEAKIDLVAEPGLIDPIPVSEGGSQLPKIYDTLENIISEFNRRFGADNLTDEDKLFLAKEMPETLHKKEGLRETMQYSDRQEAKTFFEKVLFNTMFEKMTSKVEIFKKFNDDKNFQSRYGEFIFDMMLEQFKPNKQYIYK